MIRVSEASETTESDIAFLMQKRPSQPSSVETWWWFVSPQPGSRLVPLVCHMWCYRDIAGLLLSLPMMKTLIFFLLSSYAYDEIVHIHLWFGIWADEETIFLCYLLMFHSFCFIDAMATCSVCFLLIFSFLGVPLLMHIYDHCKWCSLKNPLQMVSSSLIFLCSRAQLDYIRCDQ